MKVDLGNGVYVAVNNSTPNQLVIDLPHIHFSMAFSIQDNTHIAQSWQQVQPHARVAIDNIATHYCLRNELEEIDLLTFTNAPGLAYRRTALPRSVPWNFKGFHEHLIFPESSLLFPDADVFSFHAENCRLYERYLIPVVADRTIPQKSSFASEETISGTIWAGKGNLRSEIGRSPFQPWPVMIYCRKDNDLCLLDGTLTQERLSRSYSTEHDGYTWSLYPKTVKALQVRVGEALSGEWNYLQTLRSANLNQPYAGFVSAAANYRKKYRGKRQQNRRELIWGSWNHGICRDIDEKRLLATADVLVRDFPSIAWLQIDDGYDEWDYSENNARVGIGIAYEGEKISAAKFPGGIKRFTSEIKKRGLRPALWVGLNISTKRRLYLEHPEYFTAYRQSPHFAFLDISQEAVRSFIRQAFTIFIKDWGFEGIKLDFWSYFFEDEQICIPEGGLSGYQYRRWFLDTIRELLPEDGYLQTGCDIGMGNFHLAEHVDNYRYGIDIGAGEWSNMFVNAKWAAFCLNTHSGDFFIPNSDSIGIYPGLSDTEARSAISFCLVTRTMVELGGWLHSPETRSHPLYPYLQKACTCPDNGSKVYFGDFNFKKADLPPSIFYFKGTHFSYDRDNPVLPVVTAAIFNWHNDTRIIRLTAACLGLDTQDTFLMKDFWSDEVLECTAESELSFMLPEHSCRLFSVSRKNVKPCILESDFQINQVDFRDGALIIQSVQKPRGEIWTTTPVTVLFCEKKQLSFTLRQHGTYYHLTLGDEA